MTGKNSIASHPKYGLKGRVLIAVPYKNIIDQMAKEAHDDGNRENQLFVHSDIENTINSFKSKKNNENYVEHEKHLHNTNLSDHNNLVVHTTYNQIYNLNQTQLMTFDYIFIDEAHALTTDINFREVTITNLIYEILDFIKKCPNHKTKIIFMSGTPNAESLIIPELMKSFEIESLFQRVKISKIYTTSPRVDLVHLDTDDSDKRMDAVMKQIKAYYVQKIKVVYIFNNKEKMDEINRMIQIKIDKDCKVGYFYSGSEGKCTDNILSSKLGEYDVVLATKYFINGININYDGLSDTDIKSNKKSTQRYGLIIDMGNQYSKTSATGAIQAINRFRNRLCNATIFFPKFFKKDENNPSRKFHFGNTASLLLGINKHNVHLLSSNENMKPKIIEKGEEVKEKPLFIDKYRNNYESLNDYNLYKIESRAKSKRELVGKMEDEINIYEGWYNSLDGYNYLCKDAGFEVEIKHRHLGDQLKEMTDNQTELENKFVKNFIKKYDDFSYLFQYFVNDDKVILEASNNVNDFKDANVELKSIGFRNGNRFIAKVDMHSSFERVANKLLIYFLNLNFVYGKNLSIKILHALTDSSDNLTHFKEKRALKSITNYVKKYRNMFSDYHLKGLNYIYTMDQLSKLQLGIEKEVKTDCIIYTIKNPSLLELLQTNWTKQQFEKINYNIKTRASKTLFVDKQNVVYNEKIKKSMMFFSNLTTSFVYKSEVEDFVKQNYKDEKAIKEFDLESLEKDLNKLSNYTKVSFHSGGKLKTYETIVIPKIIYSESFNKPINISDCGYSEPENILYVDFYEELEKFKTIMLKMISKYSEGLKNNYNRSLKLIINYLKNRLQKGDIYGMTEYVDFLITYDENQSNNELQDFLKKIMVEIFKIDQTYLAAFKYSEYQTFKTLKDNNNSIYKSDIFLCDKDFDLEMMIEKKSKINLDNIKVTDIYDVLMKNTDKFLKGKNPRVIHNGNKISLTKMNPNALTYKAKAYVVLNKNSKLLYADFEKKKACKYLCDYAFKNEDFKLKNGITPVKNKEKGIYNPITFDKDYYSKKSHNKTLENYSIEETDITVIDYLDYVKSQKK